MLSIIWGDKMKQIIEDILERRVGMKIISNKRFYRLIEDLRDKTFRLHQYQSNWCKLLEWTKNKGVYAGSETTIDKIIDSLNRIEKSSFEKGKKSLEKHLKPHLELKQNIINNMKQEIDKLIKENNDLHEWVRNHNREEEQDEENIDELENLGEVIRLTYGKFKSFLLQHGILSEFRRELGKQSHFDSFIDLIKNAYPINYVDSAFEWGDTDKGIDFWLDINNKWITYINKGI